MKILIVFALVLMTTYSVSAALLKACPDKQALPKKFADMYDKFVNTVCAKCKDNVAKTDKQHAWISKNVIPVMMEKETMGVEVPANVKSKSKIVAECAKSNGKDDYCDGKQQERFVKCMESRKGEFTDAAPFGAANCEKIQKYAMEHAQQIKQKLSAIGDKYIAEKCVV